MRIGTIKGDATNPVGVGPKIIAHICNDIGLWGKGFVLAISRRWPKPEAAYRRWHSAPGDVPFELGRVQLVRVRPELWVANMIAQHGVRSASNPIPIHYPAVGACLKKVGLHTAANGASVHMPRIGCGLAGGTWDEIEPLVDLHLSQNGVPVFVYDL